MPALGEGFVPIMKASYVSTDLVTCYGSSPSLGVGGEMGETGPRSLGLVYGAAPGQGQNQDLPTFLPLPLRHEIKWALG